MNLDLINYFIMILYRVSVFYFLLKAIQELRILKYYLYESHIKSDYDKLLLVVEILLKIIAYICIAFITSWFYENYDVLYLSMNGGSLVGMV